MLFCPGTGHRSPFQNHGLIVGSKLLAASGCPFLLLIVGIRSSSPESRLCTYATVNTRRWHIRMPVMYHISSAHLSRQWANLPLPGCSSRSTARMACGKSLSVARAAGRLGPVFAGHFLLFLSRILPRYQLMQIPCTAFCCWINCSFLPIASSNKSIRVKRRFIVTGSFSKGIRLVMGMLYFFNRSPHATGLLSGKDILPGGFLLYGTGGTDSTESVPPIPGGCRGFPLSTWC